MNILVDTSTGEEIKASHDVTKLALFIEEQVIKNNKDNVYTIIDSNGDEVSDEAIDHILFDHYNGAYNKYESSNMLDLLDIANL